MSTVTATLAAATKPAKAIHAGDQTVYGSWTASAEGDTASAGLVIRLCKIPNGAVVTRLSVLGGNGVTTSDFGVIGDDDAFAAAVSASPTFTATYPGAATAGWGLTAASAQYLIMTNDAVSAASSDGTVRFAITYHLDD